MERIEAKTDLISGIAVKVDTLTTQVAGLNAKFDDWIDSSTRTRQGEWGLVVQIVAYGIMALLALLSLIVAAIKTGRIGG